MPPTFVPMKHFYPNQFSSLNKHLEAFTTTTDLNSSGDESTANQALSALDAQLLKYANNFPRLPTFKKANIHLSPRDFTDYDNAVEFDVSLLPGYNAPSTSSPATGSVFATASSSPASSPPASPSSPVNLNTTSTTSATSATNTRFTSQSPSNSVSKPPLSYEQIRLAAARSKRQKLVFRPAPSIAAILRSNDIQNNVDAYTFRIFATSGSTDPLTPQIISRALADFLQTVEEHEEIHTRKPIAFALHQKTGKCRKDESDFYGLDVIPHRMLTKSEVDFITARLTQKDAFQDSGFVVVKPEAAGIANLTALKLSFPYVHWSKSEEVMAFLLKSIGKVIAHEIEYPSQKEIDSMDPDLKVHIHVAIVLEHEKVPRRYTQYPDEVRPFKVETYVNWKLQFCCRCRSTRHTKSRCPTMTPCAKCTDLCSTRF
ncbi:unnamed protein product [Ambrosiozyma monospora]|uniref:Unnamed protein product n=1 Tax=Ambrosiozyma monospora TaxID=43982 RepID=A0A9W6YZM8_AMBMO|nr:unnamed protein product [Ambrosiozyma monospora]